MRGTGGGCLLRRHVVSVGTVILLPAFSWVVALRAPPALAFGLACVSFAALLAVRQFSFAARVVTGGAVVCAALRLWVAPALVRLGPAGRDAVAAFPVLCLALTAGILALYVYYGRFGRAGPSEASPPVVRRKPLDVVIGYSRSGPVVLPRQDRFLHVLVVGTIGTGKTSRVLKPKIYQDLEAMARGERLGLTVVEPKGDLADSVAKIARAMGLEVVYLNPLDPASPRFNPLEGEEDEAAEIMRTVLTSLFGKQEAFFSAVQQVACRNTVKLLKRLKGNQVTILDMAEALRNPQVLATYVAQLEQQEGQESALVGYFRAEVLGKLQEKMQQFALGLRLQVEDLVGNDMLRRIFDGPSGIDLDRHLEGGQVLVVNTALGALGKLGDVFGQFVVMHLQNAVFRRPGNERTRVPHFLYIDEFPRYLNPDFERLLAIGRSYRCGVVLALQNTSQLLFGESSAFRDVVLGNCRTKVVLNLDDAQDAKRFSLELGEVRVEEETRTHRRRGLLDGGWVEDARSRRVVERPRFSYTELMDLPLGTGVVKVVRNGQPLPPVRVRFELAPPDQARDRRRPEPREPVRVRVPPQPEGVRVRLPASWAPDRPGEFFGGRERGGGR